MKTLRFLLPLLLVASLASADNYQSPAEGVELRILNYTRKPVTAHFYAGAERCTRPQKIEDMERELVINVTPGQVATVSLMAEGARLGNPDTCGVFFSFRPEAGYAYRANLQLYQGACRLGFNRVRLADNEQSSAARVLRTHRMPLMTAQGLCKPLAPDEAAALNQGGNE